jgi:hypothetical protein
MPSAGTPSKDIGTITVSPRYPSASPTDTFIDVGSVSVGVGSVSVGVGFVSVGVGAVSVGVGSVSVGVGSV